MRGALSYFLHLSRKSQALGRVSNAQEARTHRNNAVVALANKLTRIAWAIRTRRGSVYLQAEMQRHKLEPCRTTHYKGCENQTAD
ncbi:MAG: hypothetical protein ABJH20_24855 [Rhizobiaceae bacterium]